MKKLVVFFLSAVLLVTVLAVPAMAASNCIVKGPDMIRAGDTITLTFYAGNIYKGSLSGTGTVVYDTAQLTLKSYTSLLGNDWSVTFFGDSFKIQNISAGNPLMDNVPIFSLEFEVNAGVAAGTTVSVTVEDVLMNNGEYDVSQGRGLWSRVVTEPLSANTDLEFLSVEGFLLSPVFAPEQQNYAVYLPNEVESLRLTAEAADYRASLIVPAVENIPVGRATYEIPVTAENGDVKIYTITTFRAELVENPNEIPQETEPATEPETEPTTEPETEPTTELETEPTTEPTTHPTKAPIQEGPTEGRMSGTMVGVLWIGSVIAAFLGGLVMPMLIWNRE